MTKIHRFLSKAAIVATVSAIIGGGSANAQSFDYTAIGNLTNDAAKSMIETVGISADHRSFMSANPLGMVIGLDIGVGVSGISLPQDFKDAMTLVGNTKNIPGLLPLPRLIVHKGLPMGIDIGGSWIGYNENSIIAGEIKWAFLNLRGLPTLAVRSSYTKAKIAYLEAKTLKADLVASKKLAVIDPYVGVGIQKVNGRVDVPEASVPGGVSLDQSTTAGHIYVGLPIDLVALRFAAEYDHSFAGIKTFGLKFGFNL